MRFIPAVTLSAAALLLLGCGDSSSGPEINRAQLRLIHASANLGAIDLAVGGTKVISGLTFGHASAPVAVPAGAQDLVVTFGSQVVGQLTGTLSEAHINAVVVASGTAHLAAVTPDTGAANPIRANIRLVNVVGSNATTPTLLDVLLKATNQAGQSPDSVQRFSVDTRVASYGPLMQLSPGRVQVKFVPAGGSTVLAQVEFDCPAGIKIAVVLERAADGTYSAKAIPEP